MQFLFLFNENGNLHIEQEKVVILDNYLNLITLYIYLILVNLSLSVSSNVQSVIFFYNSSVHIDCDIKCLPHNPQ